MTSKPDTPDGPDTGPPPKFRAEVLGEWVPPELTAWQAAALRLKTRLTVLIRPRQTSKSLVADIIAEDGPPSSEDYRWADEVLDGKDPE